MELNANVSPKEQESFDNVVEKFDLKVLEMVTEFCFNKLDNGKLEFKPNETALLISRFVGIGTFLYGFYNVESRKDIEMAVREYVKTVTQIFSGKEI